MSSPLLSRKYTAPLFTKRLSARTGVVLIVCILQGCASLYTTALEAPPSPCDFASGAEPGTEPGKVRECSVDQSIRYAALWRRQYLEAAGQHDIARSSTGLLAFPASAVALFYGLTGHGSADRITRLAVGSATAYGVNSFLAPEGKSRAYLEGALALSCVMETGLAQRNASADIVTLDGAFRKLSDALADARAVLPAVQSSLSADNPNRVRAEVALTNAENLLVHARLVRRDSQNAGVRMSIAVDRIVTQTAQLVASQQTDLASLLAMTGNLKSLAGQFGLISAPAASSPAAGAPRDGITPHAAAGVDPLAVKLTALEMATRELLVSTRLLETPEIVTTDAYKLCAPSTEVAGFHVEPTEPAQNVEEGGALSFRVSYAASASFPTASVSGNTAAVELKGPEVKDGKLSFTVSGVKASGANPAVLVITAPSGALSKRYLLTVLPKSKSETSSGTGKSTGDIAPAAFAEGLDSDVIKHLQCKLKVTQDGIWGDESHAALLKLAEQHRWRLSDTLTQSLRDDIRTLATPVCPQDASP